MTTQRSDQVKEIDKALENCADLLVFLDPAKVYLLQDFFAYQAQRWYAEAVNASSWDGVVENRAKANLLAGQLTDLRGMVENHRYELEQQREHLLTLESE